MTSCESCRLQDGSVHVTTCAHYVAPKFQVWCGPETGEVYVFGDYTTEEEAKKIGERIGALLPLVKVFGMIVFITMLPGNADDHDEGYWTIQWIGTGWVDSAVVS